MGALQIIRRDSWSGLKAASLNGMWDEKYADFLRQESVEALLLISARGYKGSKLDWLASLPDIRALRIINYEPLELDPLATLKKLAYLQFDTRYGERLDLFAIPSLTHLSGYWMKSFQKLDHLRHLVELSGGQIPREYYSWLRHSSTVTYAALRSVSAARIEESPVPLGARNLELDYWSKLENLDGLEALQSLSRIKITHASRLTDCRSLRQCACLQSIEIENVPHIEFIELPPCGQLSHLKFKMVGMSESVREKIEKYQLDCMNPEGWSSEPIVWPP